MANESTATEYLWEQLSGKLRNFLIQRVSDPELADDLLQETFLRVHTKLNDREDEQRMTAWVYLVARNLVIDHYRAQGWNLVVTMPEELDTTIDEATKGEPTNLNVQAEDWFPPMMAQLSDDYREAITQYELEGKPQQMIAENLGISLSGAKSRVQRGREKLKILFHECCSFEQDRRGNIIGYTPKTSIDGCCQEG